MRPRGFTLIELVAVMLVVSIGFVGLSNLFANMDVALTKAEAQEKTIRYAEACAEYVLQNRRDNGYTSASLTTTMCNSLLSAADSTAGYTVAPVLGNSGTATSLTGMCPSLPSQATCRDVTITASGGGMSSSVTITLASY
jgi:prepilin-type N-terminal cleavage/methylation domain-containing protein